MWVSDSARRGARKHRDRLPSSHPLVSRTVDRLPGAIWAIVDEREQRVVTVTEGLLPRRGGGLLREADRWTVGEVSNQSTGYCRDVTSWLAVAHALDDVELGRPSGFTHQVVFRRCPNCQEHNIVREDDFVCVFCGSDLPETWNVDPTV
ncbi:hypothetical protein ACFWOG_36070 [Kitasatospora sp. NPDC058406]|uniref:hypothetical protein n=1 Tax=Kitasatospora sp. NPDC058406 TaxID=3346483 RepID=UPI0036636CBC